MMQIIDGKIYETENSTHICRHGQPFFTSDPHGIIEDLFDNNGIYFLAGEGGAMTKYAILLGRRKMGSFGIIPLSKEEAFAFCREHAYVDKVKHFFPDLIQDQVE